MPVQPVSDIARLFATPFVDPKTGLVTLSWREYIRYHIHAKVFGSIDLQGIVKPGAADFSRPYVNKQLDNIPDGTTYARPRSGTLVNGVTPVPFGKNLCPNPGFESNVVGTPVNVVLTTSGSIGDDWQIEQINGVVSQTQASLTSTLTHSGGNALFTRMATLNAAILNGADNRIVLHSPPIPAAINDIVRVSGWIYWGNNTAIPAGITITANIGVIFANAAGTQLGTLLTAITNGALGFNSFQFKQASLQIPATIGGGVPASMRFYIISELVNSSGSTLNVGSNIYADIVYDDLKLVLQNTAFDLTPINTAGTPTTTAGLCQQSGTTTTINVASSTWQFGDGQISYNSGSVNPGSLGTWYIYADDPTFSGGAVTYQATATPSVCNAVNGRLVFGSLTTTGGGGIVSTGGGSGGGGPRGKAFLA